MAKRQHIDLIQALPKVRFARPNTSDILKLWVTAALGVALSAAYFSWCNLQEKAEVKSLQAEQNRLVETLENLKHHETGHKVLGITKQPLQTESEGFSNYLADLQSTPTNSVWLTSIFVDRLQDMILLQGKSLEQDGPHDLMNNLTIMPAYNGLKFNVFQVNTVKAKAGKYPKHYKFSLQTLHGKGRRL